MPAYVADRITSLLKGDKKAIRGSTILLLGVTYKPNIGDQRESPATPLAEILLEKGANLAFHDPHVTAWAPGGHDVPRFDDLDEALSQADLSVLLQNVSGHEIAH